MWKPIYDPGPWPQYIKKRENIGVPLMEVRKKYMEEQLLFENYMSHLQQLDTLHTINPLSSSPASAPSTGYGRDGRFDLRVEFYFDGVKTGEFRYYRSPTTDSEDENTYSYRDTPNFAIDCGYRVIRWNGARWTELGIPCRARQIPLEGPTTIDSPLGIYGTGGTGPGAGRIVTNWI
jgi:hypothetical protein